MDPLTIGALVAGGTALAGTASGLIGAATSKKLMNKQYELSRRWEIERATHAHQWEIQDLKNAGLNPILSAGGTGANTSGINVTQADTSGYNSAGKAMTESANNFVDFMINQQNADANTTNATTNTTVGESQASLNNQKTANLATEQPYIPGVNKSITAKNYAEASEKQAEIANIKAETDLKRQKKLTELGLTDKAAAEAETAIWNSIIAMSEGQFVQKYGMTKNQAQNLLNSGIDGLSQILTKKIKPTYNKTTINNY